MKLPRYELKAEKSLSVFEFVSEGPKGNIQKLVKFSKTNEDNVYNLAFGDKDQITGEIDDQIISNNGDSDKVLATVISAIYAFTDSQMDIWIYATGSTASRTRLYQMGISRYLEDVERDFEIYGLNDGEWKYFTMDANYSAFVAKRKKGNFK